MPTACFPNNTYRVEIRAPSSTFNLVHPCNRMWFEERHTPKVFTALGLTQSDTFTGNSKIHSPFLAFVSGSDSLTPPRGRSILRPPQGLQHPHVTLSLVPSSPCRPSTNSAAPMQGPRPGSLVPWCLTCALWTPGSLQEPSEGSCIMTMRHYLSSSLH